MLNSNDASINANSTNNANRNNNDTLNPKPYIPKGPSTQ